MLCTPARKRAWLATASRRSDRSFIAGMETQIYQFRHAIEPAIAALVALNATQAQIDDMAAMLDEMRQAGMRIDMLHFAQLDFAFTAR